MGPNGGDDEEEIDFDFGGDDGEGQNPEGTEADGEDDAGAEDTTDEARADAQGTEGLGQQPGRRDQRIARLIQRDKARDAENAELRRQIQELLTRTAPPAAQSPAAPDPVLERMRFEAMSPEERMAYQMQQHQEAMQRQTKAFELRMMDQSDRATFERLCQDDARAAKFKPEVERLFLEESRKGNFLDRSTICAYLIGKAVLAKKPGTVSRAQQRGRQAIERQQTAPSNGRSDIGGQGSRRGKTAAERLEGMTF